MNNPTILEACFKRYINDISRWLPDGIVEVNLETLHDLDLLSFHKKGSANSALTRYFHVVESEEKLTLVNEDFIVWIVPERHENISVTYTLIALNKDEEIQLELGFATKGIYNNSHLVLRLLEKYLYEIQNTEDQLARYEKQK
jgi:hypothetical protein